MEMTQGKPAATYAEVSPSHTHRHKLWSEYDTFAPDASTIEPRGFKVNRLSFNRTPHSAPDYSVYTDGSKNPENTGYGWCVTQEEYVHEEFSAPLDPNASIYMAEVMALISVTDHLLEPEYYNKKINIWSDSLSTINALAGAISTNPLLIELMDNLVLLDQRSQLTLNWVRGHSGQTGNEMADVLAKLGAGSVPLGPLPRVYNPMSYLKRLTNEYVVKKWNSIWESHEDYVHSREMLTTVKILPALPYSGKNCLKKLTEMVTGHCLLNYHVNHWREGFSIFCRLCEEGVETPQHLVRECPDLEYERFAIHTRFAEAKLGYYRALLAFRELTPVLNLIRANDRTMMGQT